MDTTGPSGRSLWTIGTIAVGTDPTAVGFDPTTGNILVANTGSANVSVISGASDTLINSIRVGTEPFGMSFDSSYNVVGMLVSNAISANVSAIPSAGEGPPPSGAGTLPDMTLPAGFHPGPLAVDSGMGEFPGLHDVFIGAFATTLSTSLLVYVPLTGPSEAQQVPGVEALHGLAYDNRSGEIFASSGDGVDVVCDGSPACGGSSDQYVVIASIGTSQGAASGVVFDYGANETFITHPASDTVSVISCADNTVVATIPVGSDPTGLAYDNATGEVFVANSGANNVSVISDASNTVVENIPVGSSPSGIAYDNTTGQLFVTNSGSDTVSVIGWTSVYSVTFPESGLPDGTVWSVNVSNHVYSSPTSSILAPEGNGTFDFAIIPAVDYAPPTVAGFAATPSSGEFTVDGSSIQESISFTQIPAGVIDTIPVEWPPSAVAYANRTGEIWVPELVVVNDSDNTPIPGTMGGETTDSFAAYDNRTGTVFESVYEGIEAVCDGSVSCGGWNGLNQYIETGSYSIDGLVYDAGTGELFVSLSLVSAFGDSYLLDVICDGSADCGGATELYQVVGTIDLGVAGNLTYDAGTGEIFVASPAYDGVFAVCDGSVTCGGPPQLGKVLVGPVAVGSAPAGMSYDNETGEIFVANYGSNSVSVICDGSPACGGPTDNGVVVGRASVGTSPEFVAYDSGAGAVFVTNSGSNNVSVISDSSDMVVGTVPVGKSPSGLAYDGGRGEVFVANSGSDNVSVIVWPTRLHSVTLSESGLPAGLTWQVTVNGAPKSLTTDGLTDTLTWTGLLSGTYAYSVVDNSGWHQSTLDYAGNILVGEESVVEPTLSYAPVTYMATVNESTLPSGLSWSITLNGDPESITTDGGWDVLTWTGLANGTYSYSISDISGWHQGLPYSGSITVSGGAGPIDGTGVGFAITLVYGQVTYLVMFSESGLPSDVTWAVTVGGEPMSITTDGGADTLTWPGLPNGTYGYSITDTSGWHQTTLPYRGIVAVHGASIVEPTQVYSPITYPVVFTETGLPAGTEWWVNVTGEPAQGSTAVTIMLSLTNGSYRCAVTTADKEYAMASAGGSFLVSGTSLSESVTFSPVAYAVTFIETGLPLSTRWWVNLTDGPSLTSTGSTLAFSEPNGTYSFAVDAGPAYRSNVTTGDAQVNGASQSISVSFIAVGHNGGGSTSSGGLSTMDWLGIGLLIAGAAGIGVVLAMRHRPRGFGTAPP